ncbi:hypothetical protein Pan181_28940 [Aeoliella mucimassa]|uniref:STAS domain-containing protein n=2 Tax=Aeoliella mucimassa TaxID=2527972 RepID=A0A518APP0_9BACT|nr:hypothetical protein Pan181_28940 [Aeoliella mucimassa]
MHSVVLQLEGAINGEWLEELARVIATHQAASKAIQLDLTGVSKVDMAAVEYLRRTIGVDYTIARASMLLAELITPQQDDTALDTDGDNLLDTEFP